LLFDAVMRRECFRPEEPPAKRRPPTAEMQGQGPRVRAILCHSGARSCVGGVDRLGQRGIYRGISLCATGGIGSPPAAGRVKSKE